MGVIWFFRGQSLTTEGGGRVDIVSEPLPVGEANYLDVIIEIFKLEETAGTITFGYHAQISNDRQNWVAVSAIDGTTSSAGNIHDEGAIRGVYVRFLCFLQLVGAPGTDVAFATFDVVGNLMRSPA